MFKYTILSEAPSTMNYNLNKATNQTQQKMSTYAALRKLLALISDEKKNLLYAFIAILFNSSINLTGPFLIGYTIDRYVQTKQYHGVIIYSGLLLGMYMAGLGASYLQTKLMGGVGQRTLFSLRNAIFTKLQELPLAFFTQNKAGDLISRVNNDTDKLNQFFSQSLMQFIGSIFIMTGAAIFLLIINPPLGVAALAPGLLLWIFTKATTTWVKNKNAVYLKSTGNISAEIQESLNNFRVIVAFNRRDYFRKKFNEANQQNYSAAIGSGLANNIFIPVFGLSANIGQLIVLAFGIYLIGRGQFSIGLLISFLSYVNNFYNPLRQLAALWTNFQVALAGWDRISQILSLETDLAAVHDLKEQSSSSLLAFRNVSFSYPDSPVILQDVSFDLEKGKTYALVGITGGGKTTTASLLARLYDPQKGSVLLEGRDLRSYSVEERTKKIGFILQDPFLFTGTVRDNILYGNKLYKNFSSEQLEQVLGKANFGSLLSRFETGLDSNVLANGESISLGQKQLIAFMRAVLRKPEILILDEATANIDTVTEKLLEEILQKLPPETVRVIIAHRLNTIENADEIFFVNSGKILRAGSFREAVDMLMHGEKKG
jgi:ATP-binding cassette, subfamily B, bacterial